MAIEACWLIAATAAVVRVFVPENVKQYSVPTVRSPEPNVTMLAGLVADEAVAIPGQTVALEGILAVLTVQLAAVVLTVYVAGKVTTTFPSVAVEAGCAQTNPPVVVLIFMRSRRI